MPPLRAWRARAFIISGTGPAAPALASPKQGEGMTQPERMRAGLAALVAAGLSAAIPAAAIANTLDRPMYYLKAYGAPGQEIRWLTIGLLVLGLIVVLTIAVLVIVAVLPARRVGDIRTDAREIDPAQDERAMPWMYAGLGLTVVALAGYVVWTIVVLVDVRAPGQPTVATIEITGHQWWWEVTYHGEDPSRTFQTANELHVPVGKPVRLVLRTADVIHTFWVPALAGKTDLIPGQRNTTWLRADAPGVYRGMCNEYCGVQHAHMALRVVAEPPEEFRKWWDHQLQPAVGTETASTSGGARDGAGGSGGRAARDADALPAAVQTRGARLQIAQGSGNSVGAQTRSGR